MLWIGLATEMVEITPSDIQLAKGDPDVSSMAVAENTDLKGGASVDIRMKVSDKGAVSIYGMGHFPVTLYKEQWLI